LTQRQFFVLILFVKDTPTRTLTEAFASIIAMMLRMIRAHGVRGLIHLPMLLLFALQLCRIGKEFAALVAAFEAGTLPLPPRAPALWTTPSSGQAARAQPAEVDCVQAADGARSAPVRPHAGGLGAARRPSTRPPPALRTRARETRAHGRPPARPRPTPDPQNLPSPPSDILVTGRCT
jgi:hypothetical protein